MKVAVRADASPTIGSGHVARTLALADSLAGQGAQVVFVARPLPAHLAESITRRGHGLEIIDLRAPPGSQAPQTPWPEPHQEEDARATQAALAGARWDWLVVDHYGLDRHWECRLRPHVRHLLAIDDLGRPHDCDLLLDANHDPAARRRYAGLVSEGARLLLGPAYALLRPEFAAARGSVDVRRGPVRRLLVSLGGMDAANATGRVLEALERVRNQPQALDVVIGASHTAQAAIEAFCAAREGRRCHVQTEDMAGLTARADAAVGAGGSATLERCCLGVPTLALALAENQRRVLAPAAAAGIVLVPDGGYPDVDLLAAHLEAFLGNSALRERISAAGLALVDGRGTTRVVAAVLGTAIQVRPARPEDSDQLYAWRNAPAVRSSSRDTAPIPSEAHHRWFGAVLDDPSRILVIGEDDQGPVGVVRFDILDDRAEVSIYLAETRLGQGLGPGLLASAEAWLRDRRPDIARLDAEVLDGNRASTLLFERSGYLRASQRFSKRIAAV